MDAGAAISWGSEDVYVYGDEAGKLWLASADGSPINFNGGFEIGPSGQARLATYTVAALPAGLAGQMAYAINGRKPGEGSGAGTGVPVIYTNSAWYSFFSGAAVAA